MLVMRANVLMSQAQPQITATMGSDSGSDSGRFMLVIDAVITEAIGTPAPMAPTESRPSAGSASGRCMPSSIARRRSWCRHCRICCRFFRTMTVGTRYSGSEIAVSGMSNASFMERSLYENRFAARREVAGS
jgi:hypothetical protein